MKRDKPEEDDEDSLKHNFRSFMKNLKLTVKRLPY